MSQAAARTPSDHRPRPTPPGPAPLRLAGAVPPPDERFAALRRYRGEPAGFLGELLALQAQLTGATAGWAFLPGGTGAAAAVGPAGAAAVEAAEALAAGGAGSAGHPLPGGAPGTLTAYPLGDAAAPVVVLHAEPSAGGIASLARERVTLTGTLWDAYARGARADALEHRAGLPAAGAAAAAEGSFEAATLALAVATLDRLGPGALAVAVGWPNRRGVKLVALAPLSEADRRTRAAGAVAAALCDGARTPLGTEDPPARLAAEALGTPAARVASAPPTDDAAGPVLLLGFDPDRLDETKAAGALDAVAAAAASALRVHARAERRVAGRWPDAFRGGVRACVGRGPGSLGRRLATAGALGVVAFLAAIPVPAPIGAGFTAEAAGAREVAAPFRGELASISVAPGDAVVAGETLLGSLATDEVRLELAGLAAERSAQLREADDTRAADPTAARLAELEVSRLDGAIALAEHRLASAALIAPISGRVVSVDLARRVGTPVERGETLFEIADPADLAASVAVPEVEAQRLEAGARGRLRPASHPGTSLPVTVTRVHPVATPGPAGTSVRVEVAFDRPPVWLKPGSRGNAKLDAGSAPLLWQWVRPTVRALRLHL